MQLNNETHLLVKSWIYTDLPIFLHNMDDYMGALSEIFIEKFYNDQGRYPDNWWEL